MRSLVLFNNKGGVGKTTLTFNIAHMMSRRGVRTVVLDYDPQCNVSALFLSEEVLFDIWEEQEQSNAPAKTVSSCIDLVRRGKGDVRPPELQEISDNLWLLPGDLALSRFEQPLAEEWPKKMAQDNERALAVTTALDLLSNLAADQVNADVVLLDVGPSLGALNRAALLACDAVVLPMAPDLFSLQGLKNVGPTLVEWRDDWKVVQSKHLRGRDQADLPRHEFEPIGYIVQQHLARSDRPVRGYDRWFSQIPAVFHKHVLLEEDVSPALTVDNDEHCMAKLKHFSSLVPIAQLARKPMFDLKRADGIGGGQIQAVAKCREEFEHLVEEILRRLTLDNPQRPAPQKSKFKAPRRA